MSDDKPFACRVLGCNQKFVNEDHLEVHRKKHDISLGMSFKSLDTPVIADQTPTPTRFLKNLAGEDVLFNDLHPNPFEAEFRKASSKMEDESDGPDTSPEEPDSMTSMDTRPTRDSVVPEENVVADGVEPGDVISKTEEPSEPQTVADIHDGEVPREAAPPQDVAAPVQAPTTVVVMSSQQAQTFQLQNFSDQLSLSGIPLNGPIMIKLPSGQTIPVLPQSVTNPQLPIPKAISANPSKELEPSKSNDSKATHNNAVKMKLKSTLLSNQSQGNMNVMAQAVDVVTKQQVHLLNPAPSNHSNEEIGLKRQRSGDEDPETKRQKFLERNRAAAMRCRNKRKTWVVDLEKRADELTSTNCVLTNEVTKLRNEVAQLKELLLAHKDCPVTLQQRAAGLFMRVGEFPTRPDQEHGTVINITTSSAS